MKRICSLIGVLSLVICSYAQQNDTAQLKKNRVADVKKMQFVHAFTDNHDTCLLEHKKYDQDILLTFERMDMKCMGWQSSEEKQYTYTGRQIATILTKRDNDVFSFTKYAYDNYTEPNYILSLLTKTDDTITVDYEHFLSKKGRIDSSYSKMKTIDGSLITSNTFYVYDKKDQIIQMYELNEEKKPLSNTTYKRDKKGKITTFAVTYYGDKPTFTQVNYYYNQYGQLSSTVNNINQRQEYFYLDNGLISSVLSYNPDDELEVEYLFRYEYHK